MQKKKTSKVTSRVYLSQKLKSFYRANWFNLISTSVALISLFIAYIGVLEVKKANLMNGSDKYSQIEIGLANFLFKYNSANVIYFINKSCEKGKFIAEFPISIANLGNKAITDVETTISFPLSEGASFASDVGSNNLFENDKPYVSEIKRKVVDSSSRRNITFEAKILMGHSSVVFSEPILLPRPASVDVSDITPLVNTVKVEYSLTIPIYVSYNNGEYLTKQVSIAAKYFEKEDDLVKFIDEYIDNYYKSYEDSIGFISYLYKYAFLNESENIYYVNGFSLECDNIEPKMLKVDNLYIVSFKKFRFPSFF